MQVPQQNVTGASEKNVSLTAGWKGQAVAALIGACAHNVFPVAMDLTDGEVHHLLQLKGDGLYEWTDLTPQQVRVGFATTVGEFLCARMGGWTGWWVGMGMGMAVYQHGCMHA